MLYRNSDFNLDRKNKRNFLLHSTGQKRGGGRVGKGVKGVTFIPDFSGLFSKAKLFSMYTKSIQSLGEAMKKTNLMRTNIY